MCSGAVRVNRSNNNPLPPVKSMEKKARSTMEVCSTNDVCAIRWVHKKVVTLAPNSLTHEPLQNCSRYCPQKKQKVIIPQPFFIRQHMGGVDQLDLYLNNLRPCSGGGKWY